MYELFSATPAAALLFTGTLVAALAFCALQELEVLLWALGVVPDEGYQPCSHGPASVQRGVGPASGDQQRARRGGIWVVGTHEARTAEARTSRDSRTATDRGCSASRAEPNSDDSEEGSLYDGYACSRQSVVNGWCELDHASLFKDEAEDQEGLTPRRVSSSGSQLRRIANT